MLRVRDARHGLTRTVLDHGLGGPDARPIESVERAGSHGPEELRSVADQLGLEVGENALRQAVGPALGGHDVRCHGADKRDLRDAALTVPVGALPALATNKRFQDVSFSDSALATGQTAVLAAVGTETTASLRYILPNGFTPSCNDGMRFG